MFSIRATQQPIPSITASAHQNYNFISVSSPFGRIFLSVFHDDEDTVPPQEIHIGCKFPCQAAAKRAIRSILSANCTPPCRCRTRSTGFPSASSSLDPFDTVPLSRTHPPPPHTQIFQ